MLSLVKNMLFLSRSLVFFSILLFSFSVIAKPGAPRTKFYNFDDLLIEGRYKKPQVLYTDARQKVKFERLLKLKKSFLPNLKETKKDPTFR